MKTAGLKFVDLFAGLGGFHRALADLGHECVFASELDAELRDLYAKNFPDMDGKVFGDIRGCKTDVPAHDILCAGFPCQPFSKSGEQLGTLDETRGTLFHEILEVLEARKPQFVILENVGNFGRHDKGRTWRIVRNQLKALGYQVAGTEHVTPPSSTDWRDAGARVAALPGGGSKTRGRSASRGFGLISPHHYGYPHHRERFFIVGVRGKLREDVFPARLSRPQTSLRQIMQSRGELTEEEWQETRLSPQQERCIEHWNDLLQALPGDLELPSFPIWGDELDAVYPFEGMAPCKWKPGKLRKLIAPHLKPYTRMDELLPLLPSYARENVREFRQWKKNYIYKNRRWWAAARPSLPDGWEVALREFPPSLRKLEWNVKGGDRNLWNYVLQFRPSGLRVKRFSSSPAMVAMTETQIPILGPQRRFLTRAEGLRLQGFAGGHQLPARRSKAFQALGNGVHVEVVKLVAERLLAGPEAARTRPAQLCLKTA